MKSILYFMKTASKSGRAVIFAFFSHYCRKREIGDYAKYEKQMDNTSHSHT